MDKKFNFQELQAIVATLRGENGCPWDKSQTHESLKLYTLEEAYEVNQAVTDLTKTGDCANLKEELGDLLFQVLLQSQVAEDNGEFAIEDVIDGIARKMIHRHPHVFAGRHYDSVEQQQADWEKLNTPLRCPITRRPAVASNGVPDVGQGRRGVPPVRGAAANSAPRYIRSFPWSSFCLF